MNNLSPIDILDRILRRWWILVILMILGGGAGWAFSQLQPPVYEATAVYQVVLDEQQLVVRGLVKADDLPLQFEDQNIYLAPAADMFYGDLVKGNLLADARSENIHLPEGDFNTVNFYLDRRGAQWFVTVRAGTPADAVLLADLWLANTDAALRKAQTYADQSISLQLQQDSVHKCFIEMNFNQANQCAGTSFAAPSDLDAYYMGLEKQISSEQQAGHGIDPALSFVVVSKANRPSHPVLYSVSLLTVSGSLIGLLVGIVLAEALHPVKSK